MLLYDVCIECFVTKLSPPLNFFAIFETAAMRQHLFEKFFRDWALQVDERCQSIGNGQPFNLIDRKRRVRLLSLEGFVQSPLDLALNVYAKLLCKLHHISRPILRVDGKVCSCLIG